MAMPDTEIAAPAPSVPDFAALACEPEGERNGARQAHAPLPRRYVAVTPWKPLPAVGVTLLIMLNCALVLVLGTFLIMLFKPAALEHMASGHGLSPNDPVVNRLLVWNMLAVQVVAIASVLWLARRKAGDAVEVLALRRPIGGAGSYAWAVPAFVVFGFGIGSLMQWLSPKAGEADTQIMLQLTHSPAWWLILIVAVVGAPLSEELVFRGFLFSALARSRIGLIGTTVVTSLLWALMHAGYSLQGMTTIFALGLALSLILWRTASTRVTMLCHGVYNGLAFLAAFFTIPGAT